MNYDEWETTGWVFNKALDEVEVPITVFYETESEDYTSFPVIESIGSYEDEDGYEQDYFLSDDEVEKVYETIYEALQEEPIYDEYGGAL
jgi:hypothetical protein